jgi:alpha-galactosidase
MRKHRTATGWAITLALFLLIPLATLGIAAPAQARTTVASSAPTRPSNPILSATPYMGWNTYFGLGGNFDAAQVLAVGHKLVDSGLSKAGYNIVWLDGGWQSSTPRGADGLLQPDPQRFPDGLASLVAQLHALGLKAGIYTDAGPYIPGSCGLGSYGHYQTDADTFAKWGFDAVKVDFLCGIAANLDPKTVYTQFAAALRNNSSGRPMIFNLCNPVTSPDWGNYPESQQSTNSWSYAPAIAQSWRTYTDVGFVGDVKFSDVLRNFDADEQHPEAAGPGHWNDPDYLAPELGMTDEEFQTQMTLWSLAAAPLVIGSSPLGFSATTIATLTNPGVLAVDQDRLGKQGTRVGPAGATETWVKPLADGSRAVVLLNRGDNTAQLSTTAAAVGLTGRRFSVDDVWGKTTSESAGMLRASVPAHGTALLIVSGKPGVVSAPRLVVSAPRVTAIDGTAFDGGTNALASAGARVSVQATVYNDGSLPALLPRETLTVPSGWSATPTDVRTLAILPGHSTLARFTVSTAESAAIGSYSITAHVSSLSLSHSASASSGPTVITVAPPVPHGTIALSHQPWVSGTSGWMQPTIDQSVGGGSALQIAGTTYSTGIGVASPSVIRYYVGGACSSLTGAVGIDDAVKNVGPEGGTSTFSIVGDGRTLFSSGTVARDETVPFDVDLTGVHDLQLLVGDAGDGGYNDRADWGTLEAACAA